MEESTPLLAERRGTPSASFFQAQRPRTIVFILSLGVFGLAFSGSLAEVPLTRLMEDNLCRRHYGREDIDEGLCKIDAVQTQLAYLNGWLPMIEAVIGLFVAFPYGAYADKKGRKPVLWLSLIGLCISSVWAAGVLALGKSVSIYTMLAAPTFAIIGGGSTVLVSVFYSIVSDVVSQADRVSAFLTVSLGSLVGGLLGPLTASALMDSTSTWVPILLSLFIQVIDLAVLVFIPETLPICKDEHDYTYDDSLYTRVNNYIRDFAQQIKDAVAMVRQPSLSIVLFAFLMPVPIAIATGALFIQYVSKRFEWSMSAAGYLLSVRSLVNIIVVLIVLPGLSKLLLSGRVVKGLSAGEKDKMLAQGSAFALAVGFLLLAGPTMPVVVTGLIVKTLGAPLPSLCRSLAAYHTNAQNTSKLQTVIGITETIGLLVSAPALAWLFSMGMKLGGVWMGLPYVAMAALLSVTAAALCYVKLPAVSLVSGETYVLNEVTPDTASIRSFSSHGTMATRVPLLRELK